MKIALDFDNVLADTMGAWVNRYNWETPRKHLKLEHITQYEFWNLRHIKNITRDDAFEIFHRVWKDYKNLSPMPYSMAGIFTLSELGYDNIEILTFILICY